MKVVFISHSDLLGGASVVTYRLMHALREQGVDARMVVYTKVSNDPFVENLSTRYIRGLKFMSERARIMLSNGLSRTDLFKVSIANVGLPLHHHPWVKEADVIALGWINQGLLSIRGIKRLGKLGKPIVWTMHDMWCMTGICHHAFECDHYREKCGDCRFLGVGGKNDLSHKVWCKKCKLYHQVPITFVAVSNWLAGKAHKSSLLRGHDVRVIPNAFPINSFYTEPKGLIKAIPIPADKDLILMGAARLDDPIKGIKYAIESLNWLFDNRPDIARRSNAVFFGEIRERSIFDNLRFPHTFIGRISDPLILRDLYASGRVVISSSLYETLPGTLVEGQASGCLPVTFGHGGQGDIVTHLKDGYIADYKDIRNFAEGIAWALEQSVDRGELHESVRRRFASEAVAESYINLFTELLGRN